MISVWKFQLGTGQMSTVAMNKGAKILSVGFENNLLYVWALVDPSIFVMESRTFFALETGTGFPSDLDNPSLEFIGRAEADEYIVHVFVLK